MIYVRIELWPWGDKSRAKLLQEVHISNDGTGDKEKGNYSAFISHATSYKGQGFADPALPHPQEIWKSADVKGFSRALSPASLVGRAVELPQGRVQKPVP